MCRPRCLWKGLCSVGDGAPVTELPRVDEGYVEASLSKATGVPPQQEKRVSLVVHSSRRPPDKLVLNSDVAHDQETA